MDGSPMQESGGWHSARPTATIYLQVRLRGRHEDISLEELQDKERQFFADSPELQEVHEDSKGMAALIHKLIRLQVERIQEYVPQLKVQVGFLAELLQPCQSCELAAPDSKEIQRKVVPAMLCSCISLKGPLMSLSNAGRCPMLSLGGIMSSVR